MNKTKMTPIWMNKYILFFCWSSTPSENWDDDAAVVIINELIISLGQLNGLDYVTKKKIFNYFDHDTKRWKHTVHFKNNQMPYDGYDITLNGESTKFLSINPNKINSAPIMSTISSIIICLWISIKRYELRFERLH